MPSAKAIAAAAILSLLLGSAAQAISCELGCRLAQPASQTDAAHHQHDSPAQSHQHAFPGDEAALSPAASLDAPAMASCSDLAQMRMTRRASDANPPGAPAAAAASAAFVAAAASVPADLPRASASPPGLATLLASAPLRI